MADDPKHHPDLSNPERVAQIDELAHRAANGERAQSPMEQQRAAAWDGLAKYEQTAFACRSCHRPAMQHVQGMCRDCFLAGPTPAPGARAAAQCGFCGRTTPPPSASPEQQRDARFVQQGESLIRGGTGGVICSSCIGTATGTVGARDGNEARRMLAIAGTSAQATEVCNRCLQLIADLESGASEIIAQAATGQTMLPLERLQPRADLMLTLGEAAEMFARIARGDK